MFIEKKDKKESTDVKHTYVLVNTRIYMCIKKNSKETGKIHTSHECEYSGIPECTITLQLPS